MPTPCALLRNSTIFGESMIGPPSSSTKLGQTGAKISSLELARLYWQVGRRDDAIREFRQAIEHKEAPADYLELCLGAVNSTSSSSEAESK